MGVSSLGSDKRETYVCLETCSSGFPDNEGHEVGGPPGEIGSGQFPTSGSLQKSMSSPRKSSGRDTQLVI
ncbi:hypothetical protein I79_020145 [Cricetulus griseus]|uniref:Uncharacterized protein n=1 Tax=Cricetulus griseus TaxID=10029 RepID=G3I9A9_CRIGR|nr:hypothetical protein I79_020145 [Cricetulus griseus]